MTNDLKEDYSIRLQMKGGLDVTPEMRAEWARMREARQREAEAALPIRQQFGMRKYILPTLVFLLALAGIAAYYLAPLVS